MKCLLHIGTEKTGTTFLQDWLYLNQETLSDQGIYLSDNIGKTNNRLFAFCFQPRLDDWAKQNRVYTREQKEKYFEGFLDNLSSEIRVASRRHEFFLITSEHLHSRVVDLECIYEIKKFLDENFEETFVVCYFRNQADMAVSLYSTALKGPSAESIDSFLTGSGVSPDNYYFNFKSIADNWSSVFGKKQCIFRIYDKERFADNDIRIDFVKSLPCEVETAGLNFSIGGSNESLSSLLAIAYQKVNEFFPFWDAKNGGVSRLNARLKYKLASLSSLDHGKIDSEKKKAVESLFESSNAEFLKEYFLEIEKFPPVDEVGDREESLSCEEVEEIVSQILSCLLAYICGDEIIRLHDSDADYLRNIALKIEEGAAMGFDEANALMLLAQRARPDGAFIAEKIDDYAARLTQKRNGK